MTVADSPGVLRVGTRGSALARAQASLVANLVQKKRADLRIETVVIRTAGDIDKRSPLTIIGGQGVFTSALQSALLRGEIDVAVHSAKDLPAAGMRGLRFAAFLAREDPRDVLITRHGCTLAELPSSPVIGTSSRRRTTQVRHARPDARVVDLRGNIDTRIKRALSTELDGIIIAAAGVTRMGWGDAISDYLPLDHFVPAPGQGALAVEVRDKDDIGRVLDDLADPGSTLLVQVERAFLRAIGAGCTTPLGAHASFDGADIRLRCMLASDDGSRAEWRTAVFPPGQAEAAAADLSRRLLALVQGSHRGTAGRAGPLASKSIVVTRPRSDAAVLVHQIEAAGGEVILAPSIRVEPVPFDGLGTTKRLSAGDIDWIAFTSRNAVAGFLTGISLHGPPAALLRSVKIAAVGEATANAIRPHGVDVALVSSGKNASDLGQQLARAGMSGQRVLLPGGNLSRSDLAAILREHGASIETIQVYAVEGEMELPAPVVERLSRGKIDALTFTSPSSVREFTRLAEGSLERLAGAVVGCIGETTAAEARRLGFARCVVAKRPGVDGLLECIATALQERPTEQQEEIRA